MVPLNHRTMAMSTVGVAMHFGILDHFGSRPWQTHQHLIDLVLALWVNSLAKVEAERWPKTI